MPSYTGATLDKLDNWRAARPRKWLMDETTLEDDIELHSVVDQDRKFQAAMREAHPERARS